MPEQPTPKAFKQPFKWTKGQAIGAAAFVVCFLIFLFLWSIRPIGIIRGPFMIFWRHPALFTLSLIFFIVGALIHVSIKMVLGDRYKKEEPEDNPYSHHWVEDSSWPRPTGTAITALSAGLTGFIIAAVFTGAWTAHSIYQNTIYRTLQPTSLEGSNVRVKPYDVASNQIDASLNSPTDAATHLSVMKVDGKLTWTAVKDPEGFWRSFSHGANGLIAVSAESSAPNVVANSPETSGNFSYSPGSKWSKNFGWHAHKICYTCDIAEVMAVPTAKGPILVAPYVKWEGGWFVKHPVFGGVFIESSGGEPFRMLDAKEAEGEPTLLAEGHIFPANLALRLAEAYAYKYGVSNHLFTHKGQFDVEQHGEESNEQPYLEDFRKLGMQWVTTLKPTGSTYTTGAIITTSAINGETKIWLTPANSSLIGGGRAIEIVRGQSGLGVVFAAPGSEDSTGKFIAIEPRQVFPPGHGLQYLVSIVPTEETRVTKNVVVDAATQSVVGVFEATASGDAELVKYLNTGVLPPLDSFNGQSAGAPAPQSTTEPTSPVAGGPQGHTAVETLERLLVETKKQMASASAQAKSLTAEKADLESLLQAAKKTAKK